MKWYSVICFGKNTVKSILYFGIYLADKLLGSVHIFFPDLFLKGQMVFITKTFDEFLIRWYFILGQFFSIQYKFGSQLWVYVECSVCRHFYHLFWFLIDTVLIKCNYSIIFPMIVNIFLMRNFLGNACQLEILNLGSGIKF